MSTTPVVIEGIDGPATDNIPAAGSKEYRDWQLNGPAERVDSPTPPAPTKAESDGEPGAAASETAKEQIETRSSKTERRFQELLADNKELKRLISELQAKPNAPAEAAPAPAAEKSEVKAAAKTLTERLREIDADLESGKYKKYEDATNDKILAQNEFLKAEAKAAEDAKVKAASDSKHEEIGKTILKRWDESLKMAKTVHSDYDEVTKHLRGTDAIPAGSITEGFVLRSKVGTEVLYHLAQNPNELKAILEVEDEWGHQDLIEQTRMLRDIELKYLSTQSAPKKETRELPPPPRVLGSGATAPSDELEVARKNGDTGRVLEIMNKRDIEAARAAGKLRPRRG